MCIVPVVRTEAGQTITVTAQLDQAATQLPKSVHYYNQIVGQGNEQ